MKVLILYTRLTGYWMACMRFDYKNNGNLFMVVRNSPSKEAPFEIKSEQGIEIIYNENLTYEDLNTISTKFKPNVVYISGWTNKKYLKLGLHYKKLGLPIIAGMDNHWLGSLKQQVATLFSRWLILRYFTHIWVPGKPQYYFARKLGFEPKNILTGLYCADETIFKKIEQTEHKNQLLFVGRLVEHKGLKILFEVLNKLIKIQNLDIKIHIVGNGPLEDEIPVHKNITHTPFIDPSKIPELLHNGGTFLLPSLYEAWGVVLHEAVLAGMPVLSTYETGSTTELVVHGYNGYLYDANNENDLLHYIQLLSGMSENNYLEMSKKSKEISVKYNLSEWSANLNSIID